MMREKKSRKLEKKVCRGRVRAFNLPIRSLGRYPYTTGSEGICGRILSTTMGLEAQKCSETVFTTSKQRTVMKWLLIFYHVVFYSTIVLRTDFVAYFSCHSLSLSLSHSAFAMFTF